MRTLTLLFLASCLAHAGVILNAPDPGSGFFDGRSDYFNFDGTGKIGNISSAQLPEASGLSTQKIFGSATFDGGEYDPYIVMVAWGTAAGSFAVDTEVAVHFKFNISPDPEDGTSYYVQGELATDDGYFYTEYQDSTNWRTEGLTSSVATNFTYLIPAGVQVTAWRVALGVGSYGAPNYVGSRTVTIPSNSIELVALSNGIAPPPPPDTTGIPEPSAIALTATGLALLIARRLRHPV